MPDKACLGQAFFHLRALNPGVPLPHRYRRPRWTAAQRPSRPYARRLWRGCQPRQAGKGQACSLGEAGIRRCDLFRHYTCNGHGRNLLPLGRGGCQRVHVRRRDRLAGFVPRPMYLTCSAMYPPTDAQARPTDRQQRVADIRRCVRTFYAAPQRGGSEWLEQPHALSGMDRPE